MMQKIHPFECIPRSIDARFIMDVGANVGDTALSALNSYPNSVVVCFEPVQRVFESLKARLEPFFSNRVILCPFALSDENKKSEINLTSFSGANSLETQSAAHKFFNPQVQELGKQTIDLFRLDDLTDLMAHIPYVDIMKIDVEGHELNVLRGGRNVIQNKVDTIIIEICFMRDLGWENTQASTRIFNLLDSYGFRLINLFDVIHSPEDKPVNMMLVQMDAVFRHKSRLGNSL